MFNENVSCYFVSVVRVVLALFRFIIDSLFLKSQLECLKPIDVLITEPLT